GGLAAAGRPRGAASQPPALGRPEGPGPIDGLQWDAGRGSRRAMKASPDRVTVRCRWLVALLVATLAVSVSAESASATTSGWGPDTSFTANIGTGFNNTV